MIVFSEAIDSLSASIGPPGSASEIARPATSGARPSRVHSSSVKSALVVMSGPYRGTARARERRAAARAPSAPPPGRVIEPVDAALGVVGDPVGLRHDAIDV